MTSVWVDISNFRRVHYHVAFTESTPKQPGALTKWIVSFISFQKSNCIFKIILTTGDTDYEHSVFITNIIENPIMDIIKRVASSVGKFREVERGRKNSTETID